MHFGESKKEILVHYKSTHLVTKMPLVQRSATRSLHTWHRPSPLDLIKSGEKGDVFDRVSRIGKEDDGGYYVNDIYMYINKYLKIFKS